MNIHGRSVSKRELERRVGSLQQIGGTRHFEYSTGRAKGVQAVEVNTGSGLVFTLLFGDKLRLHRSISTRLGRGTLKKENRLPWIEPGET